MPKVVEDPLCKWCRKKRDSGRAKCKDCLNTERIFRTIKGSGEVIEMCIGLLTDGYSQKLVRHVVNRYRTDGPVRWGTDKTKPRKCTKCGVAKEPSLMNPRSNVCRECHNEAERERYREKHGPVVYQPRMPDNFCIKCKAWKTLKGFDLTGRCRADGTKARRSECRECDRENARKRDRRYNKSESGRRARKVACQNRRARERAAKGSLSKIAVKMRFEYYGNKCKYCGSTENLHVEHQIPLSRGGTNWPSNIAPACAACNCEKGTMTNAEYLEFLENCKSRQRGQLS